jgi:hypothetical protein
LKTWKKGTGSRALPYNWVGKQKPKKKKKKYLKLNFKESFLKCG